MARVHAAAQAAGGRLPFDRFMELALYAPGLGYYVTHATQFGVAGDFVTAPEISPVFGRCLAQQCAEVLAALDGGDILEFGAGSGALAVEILQELKRLGQLPARYYIFEVSPNLRARQRDTIAACASELNARVAWLETLPARMRGVMLANEVLDAMPVQRFCIGATGQIHELFVVPDETTPSGLADQAAPPVYDLVFMDDKYTCRFEYRGKALAFYAATAEEAYAAALLWLLTGEGDQAR